MCGDISFGLIQFYYSDGTMDTGITDVDHGPYLVLKRVEKYIRQVMHVSMLGSARKINRIDVYIKDVLTGEIIESYEPFTGETNMK